MQYCCQVRPNQQAGPRTTAGAQQQTAGRRGHVDSSIASCSDEIANWDLVDAPHNSGSASGWLMMCMKDG
jgi:hypothetical protein